MRRTLILMLALSLIIVLAFGSVGLAQIDEAPPVNPPEELPASNIPPENAPWDAPPFEDDNGEQLWAIRRVK